MLKRIICCDHILWTFFPSSVCSVAKSQRGRNDGRWTTDWSRWLWPTTEMRTCRRLPVDHNKTFVLLQDREGFYWNYSMSGLPLGRCSTCEWTPWEDDSNRKRNLKDQDTETRSLALMFLFFGCFFFILILCLTRAFINSLSSSGSLPLLLCHLLLPVTYSTQLLKRVAPKQRFCF